MSEREQWPPAPNELSLAENSVHVWRAALTDASSEVLSADELDKAAQFHFEKDRNQYIAARAILRHIIGQYERIPADKVAFSYNTFGKPILEHSSLRFNVSHSGGLALLAFARNKNVGVDIERIRRDFASRELAGQFFSQEEIGALRSLPVQSQTAAFFACWTRKEAFIKGHGSGLSLPLHKFVVSLDAPARLLRTDFDPAAIDQWTLHDLAVGDKFVAALAVEGKPERIEYWRWG